MKFVMRCALVCVVGLTACGPNTSSPPDASLSFMPPSKDAGTDTYVAVIHDSGYDSGHDAFVQVDSSTHDVGVDAFVLHDTGVDVSIPDTGVDAGVDAGPICPALTILNENGIQYNGGSIMLTNPTPPKVQFIWYGTWGNNTATSIIPNLMTNLAAGTDPAGVGYLAVSSTYYSVQPYPTCTQQFLSSEIAFNGSWVVSAPLNSNLTDADLQTLVVATAQANSVQLDTNTIYFILTSADVTQSASFGSFCSDYCGYHDSFPLPGTDAASGETVKYAFVGDGDNCFFPMACEEYTSNTPNGNAGADGMVSVIMHEMQEAMTDPNPPSAWSGFSGEIGDLCAWNFGTTYTTASGAVANIKVSGTDYLVQQMWSNSNGRCEMTK